MPAWDRLDIRPPGADGDRELLLDELDSGIIEALQDNGRESFRRIANRLGVAEATIRSRVAKLTAADAIDVIGLTDPFVLGFEVMALMAIDVSSDPAPIADEIAGWSEAGSVAITSGRHDIMAELVCVDRDHFRRAVARVLSLDGVVSAESFIYLGLCNRNYRWSPPPRGDRS